MIHTRTVDHEKFIRTWQSVDSLAEAAANLKMDRGKAAQLATRYRKKGIPLKKMPKRSVMINWEKLIAIASELNPNDRN